MRLETGTMSSRTCRSMMQMEEITYTVTEDAVAGYETSVRRLQHHQHS